MNAGINFYLDLEVTRAQGPTRMIEVFTQFKNVVVNHFLDKPHVRYAIEHGKPANVIAIEERKFTAEMSILGKLISLDLIPERKTSTIDNISMLEEEFQRVNEMKKMFKGRELEAFNLIQKGI
jgi:hypothetical protein